MFLRNVRLSATILEKRGSTCRMQPRRAVGNSNKSSIYAAQAVQYARQRAYTGTQTTRVLHLEASSSTYSKIPVLVVSKSVRVFPCKRRQARARDDFAFSCLSGWFCLQDYMDPATAHPLLRAIEVEPGSTSIAARQHFLFGRPTAVAEPQLGGGKFASLSVRQSPPDAFQPCKAQASYRWLC